MHPSNIPAKFYQLSLHELVELADVKPSRVRDWQAQGHLPTRRGESFTLNDVVMAAGLDAMERLELSLAFAKATAAHILYYLVKARPSIVRPANLNFRTVEQQTSAIRSLRNRWLEDVVHVRPKRYAVIYEAIYIRITTKRVAEDVQNADDYDVVDLRAIGAAIAARATIPLVDLYKPSPPASGRAEAEYRAGC